MKTNSTRNEHGQQYSTHGQKHAIVILCVVVIYRKNDGGDVEPKEEPLLDEVKPVEAKTLASEKLGTGLGVKSDSVRAIAEIDNVLRAMCSVDEQGKGLCETCPYREHFFANQEVNF